MGEVKFYDRCGDCGCEIKERNISKRHNVCDDCWERRAWLVSNLSRLGNDTRFHKIQRSMAYKTGTARRQIIALQKESLTPNGEGK